MDRLDLPRSDPPLDRNLSIPVGFPGGRENYFRINFRWRNSDDRVMSRAVDSNNLTTKPPQHPMKLFLSALCASFMIAPLAYADGCKKECDKEKKEDTILAGKCEKKKGDCDKDEEALLAGKCKKECDEEKDEGATKRRTRAPSSPASARRRRAIATRTRRPSSPASARKSATKTRTKTPSSLASARKSATKTRTKTPSSPDHIQHSKPSFKQPPDSLPAVVCFWDLWVDRSRPGSQSLRR
jgi:hypothetical protein